MAAWSKATMAQDEVVKVRDYPLEVDNNEWEHYNIWRNIYTMINTTQKDGNSCNAYGKCHSDKIPKRASALHRKCSYCKWTSSQDPSVNL